MNVNLKQMREALLCRQKKMITKIEIDYLQQMNLLIRAKEANKKQIKAMFAKDIQSIDQLIAKNQMNHSSASPNLQFMIPSSNTNTQQNQVLNQLSNEQILQLLQQ